MCHGDVFIQACSVNTHTHTHWAGKQRKNGTRRPNGTCFSHLHMYKSLHQAYLHIPAVTSINDEKHTLCLFHPGRAGIQNMLWQYFCTTSQSNGLGQLYYSLVTFFMSIYLVSLPVLPDSTYHWISWTQTVQEYPLLLLPSAGVQGYKEMNSELVLDPVS